MGEFVKHMACPSCSSSDGFAVYEEDGKPSGGYCYVCEYSESGENKKTKTKNRAKEKENMTEKTKEKVSKEQTDELKAKTATKGSGYRGIRDDVLAAFGVRTEYNEDGEVKAVYYPMTEGGELVGWKPRIHPKTFGGSIGRTGNTCDLFGQFKFKTGGKTCLIVGGEHDQLASYQMLKDYYKSKNWEFDPVVVSPTVGETGCAKQIQAQYEFFSQFEKCIVGMDSDEAGQKAVEKIVKVLPKGRAFIAKWSLKDPNEMLEKGKNRQFISDFYDAKAYVPAGVMGSDSLYSHIVEQSHLEKVTLPPFLKTLEKMLGGGLILGHIYNIAAMTSIGKTALVNEIVYHMIFTSPHKIGVVSMELNSGQYGETLLSRHLQRKLSLLDQAEKINILEDDYTKKKASELFVKEDGSPRFFLVDDRDGTVEQIQETIEQMVIASGVKIVVIDVLQDLIEGMSNEDQALFMKWCKSMIKSHNISFVLINHTRKKGNSDTENIQVSESDVMGSSVITKSASANILLARNKLAEDERERNTTYVTLAKSRITGITGPAGKIYYDNIKHTMSDYDDVFGELPPPTPEKKEKEEIEF